MINILFLKTVKVIISQLTKKLRLFFWKIYLSNATQMTLDTFLNKKASQLSMKFLFQNNKTTNQKDSHMLSLEVHNSVKKQYNWKKARFSKDNSLFINLIDPLLMKIRIRKKKKLKQKQEVLINQIKSPIVFLKICFDIFLIFFHTLLNI